LVVRHTRDLTHIRLQPYLMRLRENALTAYAKVGSSPPSADSHAFGESDQGRDLMAFAGYPVIVSFGEASHIWKAPQQGAMDREYEYPAVHAPVLTPSPDPNTEFSSMAQITSSTSSPFHSLSTTPDPAPNFVLSTNLQAPVSWMPTEGIVPSFDAYGNVYDDGTLYRSAYVPADRDAENRWDVFLLDTGIVPGSPHNSFQ